MEIKVIGKQDELKALEKIRKMVNDLGENSYLSMTFVGLYELAKTNIENDFGISVADLRNSRDDQCRKTDRVCDELKEMTEKYETTVHEKITLQEINYNLKKQIETCGDVEIAIKSSDANILMLETTNKELEREANHLKSRIEWFESNQDNVERLKNDILILKAKLYDMMMGEN